MFGKLIFLMNPCYLTTLILLTTISATNAITKHRTNINPKTNKAIIQFLSPQNGARKALRVPPLVWDPKLAQYAQLYASQRRRDCLLKHSNGPYGENIFWGSGSGWRPEEAATAWVAERRWYNYWGNKCGWGKECGHYTQIVWKESRRVGCARVSCFGGKGIFMICNYDPPGNYIGERPY